MLIKPGSDTQQPFPFLSAFHLELGREGEGTDHLFTVKSLVFRNPKR